MKFSSVAIQIRAAEATIPSLLTCDDFQLRCMQGAVILTFDRVD